LGPSYSLIPNFQTAQLCATVSVLKIEDIQAVAKGKKQILSEMLLKETIFMLNVKRNNFDVSSWWIRQLPVTSTSIV